MLFRLKNSSYNRLLFQ